MVIIQHTQKPCIVYIEIAYNNPPCINHFNFCMNLAELLGRKYLRLTIYRIRSDCHPENILNQYFTENNVKRLYACISKFSVLLF